MTPRGVSEQLPSGNIIPMGSWVALVTKSDLFIQYWRQYINVTTTGTTSEGMCLSWGELLPLYLWRCLTEFWSAAPVAV